MPSNPLRTLAALCGASSVILGAFGAHGLRNLLETNQTTAIWQTAAHYHLIHSVVLLWLSTPDPIPAKKRAFSLLLLGLLIFSGSLYLLAVFHSARWLGAITPIGGTLLILGWLRLAFAPSSNASAPSPSVGSP